MHAKWNLVVDDKTITLSTNDLLNQRRLRVKLLGAGMDPLDPLPGDEYMHWLKELLCRSALYRLGDAVIGVRLRTPCAWRPACARKLSRASRCAEAS